MSAVLRVGILSPIEHFDPRLAADFANLSVQWHVFQTPYRPHADGAETEPVVFDGPLRSEDDGRAIEYSAAIRQGLRFSDGMDVTPRHVAESLASAPALRDQAEVELRGQRIFFRLRRPHARFDWVLCNHYCAIARSTAGKFVGSGPYVVDEEGGLETRLLRNPHYQPQPAVEELVFRVYPADDDGCPRRLIEAANAGEIDFTQALSRDDQRQIKGMRKWMGLGESTAYLHFNAIKPLFADAKVRRAAALAIDRRALAAASYSTPLAFAATGLLPPRLDSMADGIHQDVAQAKVLLAEAGVRRPSGPLELMVIPVSRPYLPHPEGAGRLIAEQLGQLGWQVDVQLAADIGDYFVRAGRGDYDMVLTGWIPDTPDLVDFFETLLASDAVPGRDKSAMSRANLSRWRSDEMDDAIRQYRVDPGQRSLNTISALLDAETPLLPLLYGPQVVVHSWRIRNRPKSFHNRPFFAEMEI